MKIYGVSILGLGVVSPEFPSTTNHRQHLKVRMSTVDLAIEDGDGKVDRVYSDCLVANADAGQKLIELRSHRVDPLNGSSEFGTASWFVQTDQHNGPLSGYLFETVGRAISKFLTSAQPRPWGRIVFHNNAPLLTTIGNSPYTAAVSIYVEKFSGRPDLVAGQTIYLGREALVISAYSAEETSPIPQIPRINAIISAYRGGFGSEQEPHGWGDYDDIEIFTQNSVILSRDVEVYQLDTETMTETVIWRGQLDKPKSDRTYGVLALNAVGELVQANNVRPGTERAIWSWDLMARDTRSGDFAPIHSRGHALKEIPDPEIAAIGMVVKQGAAVRPVGLRDIGRLNGLYRYQISGIHGAILGSYVDKKSQDAQVAAPMMTEVLLGQEGFTHFYDYGALEDRGLLTHPFDAIRCLLSSLDGEQVNGTFDTLPRGWGLGMPDSRWNHDQIDDLKSDPVEGFWFYSALQMDSLLIGDGEHTHRDLIERFLKPLLCFIAYDEDNKITIKAFIDRGPNSVDFTYTSDDFVDLEEQEMVTFDPRTEIRYKLARRGASNEYSGELWASTVRNSIGRRMRGFATDEEIDALDYGNPEITSGTWMADPGIFALQSLLTYRWELCNMALHKYTFTIQAPDDNIQPGHILSITHPAIFNPRTGENGVENARVYVVANDRHENGIDHRLEVITLGLTFESDETVAPSFRIETVSNPTNFVISPVEFTDNDWNYLTDVGAGVRQYNITVCDPDTLEVLESTYGTRQIIAYGAGSIEIDTAFDVLPTIGQVFMLAAWDDSGARNKQHAYIAAGSSGTIGAADDTGHEWGF